MRLKQLFGCRFDRTVRNSSMAFVMVSLGRVFGCFNDVDSFFIDVKIITAQNILQELLMKNNTKPPKRKLLMNNESKKQP